MIMMAAMPAAVGTPSLRSNAALTPGLRHRRLVSTIGSFVTIPLVATVLL